MTQGECSEEEETAAEASDRRRGGITRRRRASAAAIEGEFEGNVWEERFEELVACKRKNGAFDVTRLKESKLLVWVGRQRMIYKKGRGEAAEPCRTNESLASEDVWFNWIARQRRKQTAPAERRSPEQLARDREPAASAKRTSTEQLAYDAEEYFV